VNVEDVNACLNLYHYQKRTKSERELVPTTKGLIHGNWNLLSYNCSLTTKNYFLGIMVTLLHPHYFNEKFPNLIALSI
jgi:hypothetical protein